MRKAQADYQSIEAALRPHQQRTIREFAEAQGLPAAAWSENALCCCLAATLAVANAMPALRAQGLSERQALRKAADGFDLDLETVMRRNRKVKHRGPAHVSRITNPD